MGVRQQARVRQTHNGRHEKSNIWKSRFQQLRLSVSGRCEPPTNPTNEVPGLRTRTITSIVSHYTLSLQRHMQMFIQTEYVQ